MSRVLADRRAATGGGPVRQGLSRALNYLLPFICLLSSAAFAAKGLYPGQSSALEVSVDRSVALRAADERPVPLKIFYPESGGPYPLIVLSHGTFSSIDRYGRIAGYWAGQGYVVILPQHKDADYGVRPTGYEAMQAVTMSRVADLSLVLDELDSIEQQVPALEGRIDREHFVAAGHSIGTQVAMLVTGMQFRTGFDDTLIKSDETRYSALVLISDPGKMRLMPGDVWLASSVPTFMATGTEDYGLMGGRGPATEPQSEVLTNTASIARYRLLLEGGDHYFGGLVQKDTDATPDHEGLAIFNAVSTVFLDAETKASIEARAYLEQVDLPALTDGRAHLARHTAERN
ncbi:MAG: hypothetical protein P8Y61_06005 [Gammaproteobacteria bacterium]